MIGFSEDDYTGDEGEPSDVSRPNSPCTVTVEIIERTLEIPLQIKLTPGEGNATSKKLNFVPIYYAVGIHYRQFIVVKYEQWDTCKVTACNCFGP